MRLNDLTNDRQTKTTALLRARSVDLEKPLEHPRQVLPRNKGTSVVDRHAHFGRVLARVETQRYAPPDRRVLERVVQQVRKYLREPVRVAANRRRQSRFDVNLYGLRLRVPLGTPDGVTQQS